MTREEETGRFIQTGALPWRLDRKYEAEVLLVTSRRSGRWIIPKGWPMFDKSLAAAAAQEAFEEAGVHGTIDPTPLGSFLHRKQLPTAGWLEVTIVVHPLAVERELKRWPECGQRERKWFAFRQAAEQVDSSELTAIILELGARTTAEKRGAD